MASWWQKTASTAASLAGLAGGVYALTTRRQLPSYSGTLNFSELHAPVEIITDEYGVPHIYAENEEDLFFAQGFVHAQERLWQMEFNRRLCSGRLSELFGEVALEADRFMRRLGMHRSAVQELDRLPPESLRPLERYAQGVNAFIHNNANKLPVEFTILRFTPAPWLVTDSIQWSKMMGWNLGGNWETEITRARLVAKLGAERAAKLESGYDPEHVIIVPPGAQYNGINLGLLEQYQQIRELSGFGTLGGSNNWVVSGSMTESGSPILCNDPHLGQAVPSIWYECHLVAGATNVIGASFPGSPGVVIGHNEHIAWGVTNAVSDVQDLYIEKFNPENPTQYEFQGQWQDAQVIQEEIKVKNRDEAVIETVYVTRHGPILTRIPQPGQEETELPLALRWTGLEQCNIIQAVQKLDRATNWDEFRAALRDWDVPPQNVAYADREGNIGYIMAGAIPIRAQGQALLPSPGWSGEYEWTGFIPFDELPQTFNPEQQFIVTANNRIVDDSYPYYITHEWLNGYRAQRIRDLLTSKGQLTLSDMATIQGDYYSLPAAAIVPSILKLQPTNALEKAALEILQAWDYVLTTESVAAAIYMKFFQNLERIVLNSVLGADETLLKSYLGTGSTIIARMNGYASRSRPLLIRLLKEHDDSWFDNTAIPNGPHSWDEALTIAFQSALDELRSRFGSNILHWNYGSIHKMTYNHPLGAVKALSPFFNRGPYPVGGDIDTVNMGTVLPDDPEVVVTVPSYRQIVDLGNLSNSLSVHAPGQSGHPGSKHYDDFIELWRTLKHHPMLFERSAIEQHAAGTLNLTPKILPTPYS